MDENDVEPDGLDENELSVSQALVALATAVGFVAIIAGVSFLAEWLIRR